MACNIIAKIEELKLFTTVKVIRLKRMVFVGRMIQIQVMKNAHRDLIGRYA
jgi:hypothetical protein